MTDTPQVLLAHHLKALKLPTFRPSSVSMTSLDVSASGMLLESDYSEDAEAEADWLAAAMLLPRDALIRARRRGDSVADIAAAFGTSEQLCEWRIRMTGVGVQLKRAALR